MILVFAVTVMLLVNRYFVLFRQCHRKQVVWIIKLEKLNFDLMKFHDFSEFIQLIIKFSKHQRNQGFNIKSVIGIMVIESCNYSGA